MKYTKYMKRLAQAHKFMKYMHDTQSAFRTGISKVQYVISVIHFSKQYLTKIRMSNGTMLGLSHIQFNMQLFVFILLWLCCLCCLCDIQPKQNFPLSFGLYVFWLLKPMCVQYCAAHTILQSTSQELIPINIIACVYLAKIGV